MAINNTVENINNQPTIEPRTVTGIFTKYIAKTLPLAFDESMSYYECLCALLEYLNETIVPDINNTNEGLSELQTFYLELQSYVNNYFDNLDIQEEVNIKLDKMVEDGTISDILSNYFSELEADYNQKYQNIQDNINTRIDQVNIEINALESIGPIPVTSTSDMTDETKIYVNTTNGYWYYYDGDSWEQGGLYQSSQNIDELQGLVDAFKTNNIKGLIDFSVGNVGTSTGEYTPNNFRIYTTDIVSFPIDIYIDYSTFVKTNLYIYNADNTYIKCWENSQNENKGSYIPANQKFRLSCTYVTLPDPVPNLSGTDPKDSALYEALKIYRYKDYRDMQFTKLKSQSYNMNIAELKYQYPLLLGDYGTAAGMSQTAGSFRRIIPWYVMKFPVPVRIKSKIAASSFIWYYDDVNETNPTQQGWKDIYNSEVVIPANQCFRFVTSYSSTYNEPLYNVYDNDIFKNLIFEYVVDEEPTTFENNNLHYIKSVAHQGYSNTGTVNYCKLQGYQNAKDYGFDYGELDIRMTSDNVLVCSHDDTFESGGETITISQNTYSDLSQLDYYGGQLATFESIIALCKKIGLGVYIDHLYTLNATGWDTMFNIIKKYQMQDNVVYLCNTQQAQITRVLNFYYKSKIAIVTESTDVEAIVSLINANKTNFNEFSIDTKYSNYSISDLNELVNDLPTDVKVEVWTIDNVNVYKQYMPYVSGITSNNYSVLQVLSNE